MLLSTHTASKLRATTVGPVRGAAPALRNGDMRALRISLLFIYAGCASAPEAPKSPTKPVLRAARIQLKDFQSPFIAKDGTVYAAVALDVGQQRPELLKLFGRFNSEAPRIPGGSPLPDWVVVGSGAYTTQGGSSILLGVGVASGLKNKKLALATAKNRARSEVQKLLSVLTTASMKDFSASTTAGAFSSEHQLVEQAIRTYRAQRLTPNTESYDRIDETGFVDVSQRPLSTFSIDVDTASYANVRRFLKQGQLPPKDAVRVEELVNYFDYSDPLPDKESPFSINVELAECPWERSHRLVRVGLKTSPISRKARAQANLVFLLDVSGSMNAPNKLPLLRRAMKMLIENLNSDDRVAIVVYAGASGLALPSTPISRSHEIMAALDRLTAGGSTNGGAGIRLAYQTAQENFIPGGINRVILATDGDFNVGTTSRGDLTRLIEKKASQNIFLTVLGFGMGNYKDATLQELADRGNGNHGYVDGLVEARKLLVEQIGGTLITVAKDVKLQIEFNPKRVGAYRLIGYENRRLKSEDFKDDTKDAGEIGAGHTVTALYELIPPGQRKSSIKLKYQTPRKATGPAEELMTVKVRYKRPESSKSVPIRVPVFDTERSRDLASSDLEFASAVAEFGMLLRRSDYRGGASYDAVLERAQRSRGKDARGYRAEFIELVKKARRLSSAR